MFDSVFSEIAALKLYDYTGRTAVRVHSSEDAKALSRAGADAVLSPFTDWAKKALDALISSKTMHSEPA